MRPQLIFQHDGAPPHSPHNVRDWLDEHFPERWVGTNGPIAWPPRSPDLTPLDFFLWGHVKELVYATPILDEFELQRRVTAVLGNLNPDHLQAAVHSIEYRAMLAIGNNGGHIEHLLHCGNCCTRDALLWSSLPIYTVRSMGHHHLTSAYGTADLHDFGGSHPRGTTGTPYCFPSHYRAVPYP